MKLIEDVIWIGEISDRDEKKAYLKVLERNKIDCKEFVNVESGMSYIMTSLKFKVILVLVNDDLFVEYSEALKKNIDQLTTLPLTIIFSRSNIESFKNNCLEGRIENDFYNPGGVKDNFNEIIAYIKKYMSIDFLNSTIQNKVNPENYDSCYSFEYIKTGAQLVYPYLYNDIISNKKITDKEIQQFNQFLIEQFSMNDLIEPLTVVDKSINPKILSKFYVKAYSSGSSFYPNLNWSLMMLDGKDYFPFVKTLYQGMQYYCYKELSIKLYRGAMISEKELEKMKKVLEEKTKYNKILDNVIEYCNNKDSNNILDKKLIIPKILFYSRCFLSFSKELKVAKSFQGNVLFELNLNYLDLREIQSNSDISEFSKYSNEKEILFYPFSNFSIEKIVKKKNGKTKIYLESLGKYRDSIKEIMKSYKNNFWSFEEDVNDSKFANDIKQSKFIHLEDALKIAYKKITGKSFDFEVYKKEYQKYLDDQGKKRLEDVKESPSEKAKKFVNEIFNWVLGNLNKQE